jgi:hypothetical protein
MTDEQCIENYLRPFLAAHSIEELRPDFPRWARRLHAKGIHQMPAQPGDPGSDLVDLFVLQAAPRRTLWQSRVAHLLRDVTGSREQVVPGAG